MNSIQIISKYIVLVPPEYHFLLENNGVKEDNGWKACPSLNPTLQVFQFRGSFLHNE